MNYGSIANSLLDVLEEGFKDPPLLIVLGSEYRRHDQWDLATEMTQRQHNNVSADLPSEQALWLSVHHMYLGASSLVRSKMDQAQGFFRTAERGFKLQQNHHGTMAALLAQGRTYQIEHQLDKAEDRYRRCLHLSACLERQATARHDYKLRQTYERLRDWLNNVLVQFKEAAFPRLLQEVEAIAGEPAYLLAEDDLCQTTTVFLDHTKCRLIGWNNGRQEIMCALNPHDRYFVTRVRGDSMQGTTRKGRPIDIRGGDRLLTRYDDTWPSNETIGVFKEAERPPIVKIFRQRSPFLILASANPLYKDRVFDADAPQLQPLGSIVAILEEAA